MSGTTWRWLNRTVAVVAIMALALAPGLTADFSVAAKSGGSGKSSSSSAGSSKSTGSSSSGSSSSSGGLFTWQSKSTQPHTSTSLWDRSTPPATTPTSGGYAKPAGANTNAPPSAAPAAGGYAKPAGVTTTQANPATAPTSGGYAKPAMAGGATVVGGASAAAAAATTSPANTNVPSAANANAPAAAVSSGGYTKPGVAATPPAAQPASAPAASANPAAAVSSGGYTKPGAAVAGATAGAAPAAPAGGVTSSGGYAKPGAPAAVAATGSASAPGGGTPPGPPPVTNAATPAAKPPTGGFDRGAERQIATQSLARYKAEQAHFAESPQGTLTGASDFKRNPLYANNAGHYRSYNQAYAERDAYRTSNPWTPPAYAFRSAPSFGMWDALFWWMVLDKITEPSHAAAAYNNANDPGFQAWHKEAERQAADNAELKAKLDAMDAKLTSMEGQPRKPGTLPEGVPASVALAPEVAVAPRDKSVLVMGTGAQQGNYYPFCQGGNGMQGLRGHLKGFAIECRVTNGSTENLDGLADGTFDAIMVQSDVFGDWLAHHPGVHLDALKSTIYQEFVQVLANKQAKVQTIGDLDAQRHILYLVGSGAQKTWDSFTAADPRYAAFDAAGRLRRVPNDPAVLETVAGNPDAVMMFVSGLKSDLLRQANDRFGDRLSMVLVDDRHFADVLDATGHPVYAYAKIPGGVYPKLQRSRWFGLTSSVPSLTVGGLFILSDQWVSENGVASLSKVEDALWHAIPEIEKKVGTGS